MNIPVEIVAACCSVYLTAALINQRALWKRIVQLEKNVRTLITILGDRGLKIPEGDTESLLKEMYEHNQRTAPTPVR